MARITCRTPSTGKPITVALTNLGTAYTTVAEAPDFSVPDPSERFKFRDPVDNSRAIRPGEVFFLTPVAARNKTTATQTIETQLVREDGLTIELGSLDIPAGDTGFVPIQGRSLLNRDPTSTYGDRIQLKSSEANSFDIWSAAEERLANEHNGVEDA